MSYCCENMTSAEKLANKDNLNKFFETSIGKFTLSDYSEIQSNDTGAFKNLRICLVESPTFRKQSQKIF